MRSWNFRLGKSIWGMRCASLALCTGVLLAVGACDATGPSEPRAEDLSGAVQLVDGVYVELGLTDVIVGVDGLGRARIPICYSGHGQVVVDQVVTSCSCYSSVEDAIVVDPEGGSFVELVYKPSESFAVSRAALVWRVTGEDRQAVTRFSLEPSFVGGAFDQSDFAYYQISLGLIDGEPVELSQYADERIYKDLRLSGDLVLEGSPGVVEPSSDFLYGALRSGFIGPGMDHLQLDVSAVRVPPGVQVALGEGFRLHQNEPWPVLSTPWIAGTVDSASARELSLSGLTLESEGGRWRVVLSPDGPLEARRLLIRSGDLGIVVEVLAG